MRLQLGREIIADGWAWLALMLLLAVTTLVAFLPLGNFSLPVALLIGALKTMIVLTIFMKLCRGPSLARLFGGAGLFWLAILLALIWADYLTRPGFLTGTPTQ